MGGKALALQGVQTRRYNTGEFLQLADELIPRIKLLFNTDVHLVEYYHTKESHGDMDLLVLNTGNLGNIRDKIQKEFNPTAINCNGNCTSFDYKELQIDIISQPAGNWETAKIFFGMDPSGNLFGKISHSLGLKYGFDGLKFIYRYNGKRLGEITISKDNRKIFEFLGYDYDRYLQGFDTKQEIFDYVISSKYFNPVKFQMENLTGIDRKRNRKRQTYQEFLVYINSRTFDTPYKFKSKLAYRKDIDAFFPEANFMAKLKEFRAKEKMRKIIASKFNGNLVMGWTGLGGKELGKCLSDFANYIEVNYTHFREFILKSKPEYIKETFDNWYVARFEK